MERAVAGFSGNDWSFAAAAAALVGDGYPFWASLASSGTLFAGGAGSSL